MGIFDVFKKDKEIKDVDKISKEILENLTNNKGDDDDE